MGVLRELVRAFRDGFNSAQGKPRKDKKQMSNMKLLRRNTAKKI